jgi:endonuclease/exonuclease/phosphatase family metal-dependent hydrolase
MLIYKSQSARGRALATFLIYFVLIFLGAQSIRAERVTLKVLTFNAWLLRVGPWYRSSDIPERITLIPHEIAKTQADIVLFQEVWGSSFRNRLIDGLKEQGFIDFAYTEIHGNGLLTASKFPIRKVQTMQFSRNTAFIETFEEKGAMLTRIEYPQLGLIDVYNTHLGSVAYDERTRSFKHAHIKDQDVQIRELQEFVYSTAQNASLILGGDFNFHYNKWMAGRYWPTASEQYESILANINLNIHLRDAARPFIEKSGQPPFTFSLENPYVSYDQSFNGPSSTLDYIFLNRSKNNKFYAVGARRVFDEPIDPNLCERLLIESIPKRLSDHFGILVELGIKE